MKTAFFIVLLANLTFWMYERQRGAVDRVAEAPLAPDAAMLREPIVLAGEQEIRPEAPPTALTETASAQSDTQKTTDVPEAVTQPPAQPNTFACYEAGPFPSEQMLNIWGKAIGEVEGSVKPMTREGQEIINYMVLYPTAGSKEDIKAAMQNLRDQGISDAFPLATGAYKGYISLGVFRREPRALRLQQVMQGKGIEAIVMPRLKDAGRKFALFSGQGAIEGRLGELGQKYPGIQFRALPDSDPNCLGSRPAQAARPATESPVLPKSDSKTPSGNIVASEHAPVQAGEPAVQKAPVQEEQKPSNDAAGVNVVNLVCYEAGPFPNEQSLIDWQKQVKSAQGRIKPVFRDGKAINDYLVLYPSSGGEEATKAAMQMLRERGLKDVWPLPAGELQGQISLGVFKREGDALQMQKSLLDRGVDSVVSPRYKSKKQKYALIAGAGSIAGSLQAMEVSHPDIKLRKLSDFEQNCSKEFAVKP